MIRLTIAALAVTIAMPALAVTGWTPPEHEPPVQEPETPAPKPEAPEPEAPPPKPERKQGNREPKASPVPMCCTRAGAVIAKRVLFGQGKLNARCAAADVATLPACEGKVRP